MAVVYRSVLVGDSSTPNGKTVIPINNVGIWLQCAGLSPVYSTVSQILADTVTLTTLISNTNAVDYMARSTSFASDVCSDETSMQLIGANDYCAETLLTNVTWINEICNSQYFEEVLNVKVPIMTSNTTPSGVVSADSIISSQYPAYYAFDNNDATLWCGRSYPVTVFYEFVIPFKIFKMDYKGVAVGNTAKTADIIDGNNEVIQNISFENVATLQSFSINNSPALNKVGLKITEGWGENGHANTLQFYGRAGYMNALSKITMTSDEYECTEAMFWIIDNTWYLRAKFNKLVTNGAIRMSVDLSDWLTGTASYSGFTAKTTGYNPVAFSSSFTDAILTVGIDTNSGQTSKPDYVDLEFSGTV